MPGPESIPVRLEGFCIRELDDDIILISEKGDSLHSINDVGSFIWKQIDGNNSVVDILNFICDEFDVEIKIAEKDLNNFLSQLYEKKLISYRE